jgi:predicted TIM-barrel fold metal-dependent hydrolase
MIDDMFVIDAHAHIYPPQQTIWGLIGQTYEDWIARMNRNGIDMSVVMGAYKLTLEDQRAANDYVVEAITAYPNRFVGLMWVTPLWGEQQALDEIRRGADMGLRGLKLYPHGHGNFPLDTPLLDPIIRLAQELGWIVVAHTDIDSKVCSPHLAIRLAKRHPDVPLVLAHMGMNSDVTHFIPDYVKDQPNIYLDTSDTPNLPEFVYKTPMALIPDRMLFGSDAPTLSPEVELKKVEVAEELYGLTREEKRKILGENAARLYEIDIPSKEDSQ